MDNLVFDPGRRTRTLQPMIHDLICLSYATTARHQNGRIVDLWVPWYLERINASTSWPPRRPWIWQVLTKFLFNTPYCTSIFACGLGKRA